ncbi:hypothetical protein [Glutamicibacter arilaitensis]|uniref:hypothetical protein n=1 Tax=Glutamicibacter arilaitensis TaxID=256701 RepID=UPI0038506296
MNTTKRFLLPAVLLSSLALSACTGSTTAVAPAPSALGEATYAFYLSAPSTEIDRENRLGSVVLVGPDGQSSSVSTWGMDYGSLAWTDKGLHFSDMKNDYRLDETGLASIESEKTDSQYTMLATDADTVVGLYNLGFTEQGYASQLVTTTADRSTLTEIEGGYYVTANCDGTIYGAGIATGEYSRTNDPDTEPMMLNQLTNTKDGKEKHLGLSADARDSATAGNAPCIDGKIYYISDARKGGLEDAVKPVLSSWDVTTGEYSQVPIRAESNDEPLLRPDGTGYPQVTPGSVKDGKIEWFGAGNSVMSTDIKTGQTTRKFMVEGRTDDAASSQAVFTAEEVVVLVDNGDGTDFRFVHYDRSTGEELMRRTLEEAPDGLNNGMILRGMAIKP